MFLGLPALAALFLYIAHRTHYEFLFHLAAIPLEILLGGFLVERYLSRKEKQDKLRQLMYLKSYIFRTEMRSVYIRNFHALEKPAISIAMIRNADIRKLAALRDSVGTPVYRSLENAEDVVVAYVQSEGAFQNFLEWSINNNFENIFEDMIHILHFIQDAKLFKESHPDRLFMDEVHLHPAMEKKVYTIFRQGIVKFLEYAIELKEKQPDVFDELMADYEAASCIRRPKDTACDHGSNDAEERLSGRLVEAAPSSGVHLHASP